MGIPIWFVCGWANKNTDCLLTMRYDTLFIRSNYIIEINKEKNTTIGKYDVSFCKNYKVCGKSVPPKVTFDLIQCAICRGFNVAQFVRRNDSFKDDYHFNQELL